jgi:hypothetical protein
MDNQSRQRRSCFIALILVFGLVASAACQMSMSGSIGGKVLYPNVVGDPRQKMYETPGLHEGTSANDASGLSFPKIPSDGGGDK